MKRNITFILILTALVGGCGERKYPAIDAPFPQDFLFLQNSSHDISIRDMSSTNGQAVPAKVLAAAWNDDFLLAAQAPLTNRSNFPGDSYQIPIPGMTNYWIIRIKSRQIAGPLTFSGFSEEKAQLHVPEDLQLISVARLRVQ